jgi:hypothetical protein
MKSPGFSVTICPLEMTSVASQHDFEIDHIRLTKSGRIAADRLFFVVGQFPSHGGKRRVRWNGNLEEAEPAGERKRRGAARADA